MKKKKILKFIRNLLIIFFGSSILSVIALRFIPVYFTPLMFIRTAQQIIHGEDIKWKHTWVSKEKISRHLPMAVIASEDNRFAEHNGFDFKEIEKAPTAEALEQLLCLILQERMGLSKIALSKFKKEVQAVIIYVNAHYMDKLTLDSIADYVGLNREYLSRLFSKETGTGLFQYINEVRMKRAGEMIRSNKQVYIKEVAAAVGFDDPYFFSRKFKDFYGKTPSEYAEG